MGRCQLPAKGHSGQPGLLVRGCAWTRQSDGGESSPSDDVVGLALGTIGILGCRRQLLYHASCSDIALGGLMSVSAAAHRGEAILPRFSQCVRVGLNRTLPAGIARAFRRNRVYGGRPTRVDDSGGGAPRPVLRGGAFSLNQKRCGGD